MTQKIKYGIIGAGSMGREHISNIAIIEEAEVVGLSDPHNNSLQESLSLLGNDIPTFKKGSTFDRKLRMLQRKFKDDDENMQKNTLG